METFCPECVNMNGVLEELLVISTRSKKSKTEILFYNFSNNSITKSIKISGVDYGPPCFIGEDYLGLLCQKQCQIKLWKNINNKIPAEIILPDNGICMGWTPDGNYLCVGIKQEIYIWQLCSGLLICKINQHTANINRILFLDDGIHFLTCADDCSFYVWNINRILTDYKDVFYKPNYVAHLIVNYLPAYFTCTRKCANTCYILCILDDKLTNVQFYNFFDCTALVRISFEHKIHSFFYDADEETLTVLTALPSFMKVNVDTKSGNINAESCIIRTTERLTDGEQARSVVKFVSDNCIIRGLENIVEIWSSVDLTLKTIIRIDGLIYDIQFLPIEHIFYTQTENKSLAEANDNYIPKPVSRFSHQVNTSETLDKFAKIPILPRSIRNHIELPNYEMEINIRNASIDTKDDNNNNNSIAELISNYYKIAQDVLLKDAFKSSDL